ncbi:MAG: lysophospholipid acyltransferase family protein [Nitrospirae bacterium]|nr:lysophospholipid acyltransferase family protein [Nitrospirota bacterium]
MARRFLKTLKKRLASNILPYILSAAIGVLYCTLRVKFIGAGIPEAFHKKKEGVIFVFWHSMMIPAVFVYRGDGIHVLVSRHGDGELIGRVVKPYRCHTVRGSSSRGGMEALKELVRLARKNRDIAITPDGPRGPAEQVKPGVAQLAKLTGRPVIPGAYSASWIKRLKTWDRFRIPMPFSRLVYVIGEPLYFQKDEDIETFRLRVEEALKEVTRRADDYFNS